MDIHGRYVKDAQPVGAGGGAVTVSVTATRPKNKLTLLQIPRSLLCLSLMSLAFPAIIQYAPTLIIADVADISLLEVFRLLKLKT